MINSVQSTVVMVLAVIKIVEIVYCVNLSIGGRIVRMCVRTMMRLLVVGLTALMMNGVRTVRTSAVTVQNFHMFHCSSASAYLKVGNVIQHAHQGGGGYPVQINVRITADIVTELTGDVLNVKILTGVLIVQIAVVTAARTLSGVSLTLCAREAMVPVSMDVNRGGGVKVALTGAVIGVCGVTG